MLLFILKIYLCFIIFVICIFLFFLLLMYRNNYYRKKTEKPILYKNVDIELLKKYDFDYFKKNHGDMDILITYSKPESVDMLTKVKRVTLKDYCDKIMHKHPEWYFKTEDEYDFLALLGIKNDIVYEFDKIFNTYKNIVFKNTSFWMGAKNSTTGWHTDVDDLSYLYLVKGKKKISLVSPKYNSNMYIKNIYAIGSKWSHINFKDVDYKKYPKFKDAEVLTYILNEGDCIFIPKNWWHCVENLEDSIGITYKLYRQNQLMYTLVEENFRKLYYNVKDTSEEEKLLKNYITKEEYEKYSKIIKENNKKLILKK